MKKTIKINFCDFWPGFYKNDNYFSALLSKRYHIELSEHPDFIFFSCYGKEYLKYNCIRIFYSPENLRPDFTGCDYALTFDYIAKENHFRLPLYGLFTKYSDTDERLKYRKTIKDLIIQRSGDQIANEWSKKKGFCCMVVSNPDGKKRIDFFKTLNSIKHVDSGGRLLNNIGGPVPEKLPFIKDYKFVIAFENSSYPGYVTEKIIEPFFVDSIPIYWGNKSVKNDFNCKRFLNYHDFSSEEALIKRIIEIDQDDNEAFKMLSEPVFPGNVIPSYVDENNVLDFFDKIFSTAANKKPVANTGKRYLHAIYRKKRAFVSLIKYKIEHCFSKFKKEPDQHLS